MSAHDAGAVLAALGDDTRRALVQRLAAGVARTATELAAGLPISRQAVARHLVLLREARLVRAERVGRETRYALDPAGVDAARSWLDGIERTWDARLDRLADLAETE